MRNPSSQRQTTTVFERKRPDQQLVARALAETKQSPFWLDDLGDVAGYAALDGGVSADLAVVGGGYTGLWTAVLAKRRNPDSRVVLLEGKRVGWAASGRNGGFCDASLTHGESNGQTRWPKEMDVLERLGAENLDSIERSVHELGIDCEFERTGTLDVAVEPHQIEWLDQTPGVFLDTDAVRAEVNSPTYLAGAWSKDTNALVHPAKLAKELARVASELGVEVFEKSPVTGLETSDATGPVTLKTASGTVRAARVALGTNAFPSLLKRHRLMTVPVYDYVLMTEPLSEEQLASIGWKNRQGVGDLANQFHYYRLSHDNRILWGGYDAIYHYGRRIQSASEYRPQTFEKLASHFFTTFPQLEGVRFTHRWAGAIDTSTQFCAFFGLNKNGRVASAAGFTGLGVAATHFAAEVMLDRLAGQTTERTELEMVKRMPLPFPPEPLAYAGIQATRWALNRADHNEGKRNVLLRTLDAVGLGFDS
jgi:glycine/D-amino acid oxidase-like deaminating enzyme